MSVFEEIKQAGGDLFVAGLVDSGSGSISVRQGDRILMTRLNAPLAHLSESDVIDLPLEGTADNDQSAARELPVHRAIYKETDFKALIFSNPPFGIALSGSTDNKIMPPDMKGQAVLKSIPVVRAKAIMPGREQIGVEELTKFLPPVYRSGYVVALVKDYGCFAVGENVAEALRFTTCVEASCKIIAVSKMVSAQSEKSHRRNDQPSQPQRRSAIPPSIGVMDRSRGGYKRGFGR